jgi:probable rRNA maturation factor
VEPEESGTQAGIQIELDHPARAVDTARLARVLERVVAYHGFEVEYLGIILSDSETVHELNRTFLDHDYPTDVISFPLDDDALARKVVDGEVYVDLDTAAERAPEFGTDFEAEVTRYAIHGLLHLLGHDDATDEQRQQMRQLEDRFLSLIE